MSDKYHTTGSYVQYQIEYLPDGYYRCEKCKTLVPIISSVPHECVTVNNYPVFTFSYPTDRQLLQQILNELQEIKMLLRNK